jgi:hypothetical protein
MMTPLCALARKHETDKGGEHFRYGGGDSDTCHNYTPHYHELFEDRRDLVQNLLEIGVNAGSSLRMWREYFPNAQILGLDTDAKCLRWGDERITIRMADQNSPSDLIKATADWPLFDIIIDDGSHERDHQVVSLQTLLPKLMPGGIYVVEDLGAGGPPFDNGRFRLYEAVPSGYKFEYRKIEGGLGWKVQPHEWLFIVRRDAAVATASR